MPRMRAPERRRQLLEVAAELFADRGFRGTTTSELASAAGVTEPILYRHFESKQHLFLTLIDEVGREVITNWKTALDDCKSPKDRLRVLLEGNPATHARGRGIYRVIFQAMTEPHADKQVSTSLRRHVTTLHAFLRTEVEALQDAGLVRKDQSAATLAHLMIDVAIGYGMVAPIIAGRTGTPERGAVQGLLEEFLTRPGDG